jgi:Fur family zinc uptake transcriptional regulator
MSSAEAVFPACDHDHQRCVASILARAERQCVQRNARLTPHRRRVLEVVAAGHRAIGAYDIISRLSIVGGYAPAPISIYRALEFLLQQSLVHRVESLNAYVACPSAGSLHAAQFLICRGCGTVAEMKSPVIEDAIAVGTESAGFAVIAPIVEIAGICQSCAGEHP